LQATAANTRQGTFEAWAALPGKLTKQQQDNYQQAVEILREPKSTALKQAAAQATIDQLKASTANEWQRTTEAAALAPGVLTKQQQENYQRAKEILNEPKSTALKMAEAQRTIDRLDAEIAARKQQTGIEAAKAPGDLAGQALDNAGKAQDLRGKPAQQAANLDLARSQAEYNREGRGQMKATAADADIKPFVVNDEIARARGEPTPIYGDPGHLANMRAAIMEGTGEKQGSQAAATANQALREISKLVEDPKYVVHGRDGVLYLPDGTRLQVGQQALDYLLRLRLEMGAAQKKRKGK
jgi:hypothetical protein